MEAPRTLPEYRAALAGLLREAAKALTDAERSAMQEIVRRRRNGRRDQAETEAAAHVSRHADQIVDLLSVAARELRPRETQQLDDLVAGRAPRTDTPPSSVPVRLRRSGRATR